MSNFKNILMRVIRQHNKEAAELEEAEIPQIIHRIWLGNEMPKDTFLALLHFQNHLRETGTCYVHILWTYSVEDAGLQEQLAALQKSGMTIHYMTEVWDDCPEIRHAVEDRIIKGKLDSMHYKIASDIFRMYILCVQGGIYMDADIDVRGELFDEPLFHRFQFKDGGYMPLLGSVSPFDDLFEAAGGDLCAYIAFEYSLFMEKNYGWNYFFASVPGNPAIEQMLREVCRIDGQSMTVNLIDRFFAEMPGTKEEKRRALFDYAFAPLDLQYCTRASVEK